METAIIVAIGLLAVALIGFQVWGKLKPGKGSGSGCGCGGGHCGSVDQQHSDKMDCGCGGGGCCSDEGRPSK